jgi:hypothetical protein
MSAWLATEAAAFAGPSGRARDSGPRASSGPAAGAQQRLTVSEANLPSAAD